MVSIFFFQRQNLHDVRRKSDGWLKIFSSIGYQDKRIMGFASRSLPSPEFYVFRSVPLSVRTRLLIIGLLCFACSSEIL